MASIPLLKSFLPTSTPIHQNKDDNHPKSFQRIFISSSAKSIDELSPIKDILPSNQMFSSYLNDLDNQISDFALQEKNEPCVIRAAKKLRFNDFSNPTKINVLDNYRNFENDSGFGSVNILSHEEEDSPDLKLLKNTDVNCSFPCDKISCTKADHLYKDEVSDVECKRPEDRTRHYNSFNFFDSQNATGIVYKQGRQCIEPSLYKGVDLISSLYWMNCTSILSQLLSYLSNEDLRNASNVNKTWRTVIVQDAKANARRNVYLKEKKEIVTGPNKENRFCTKVIQVKDHKRAFADMTNDQKKPFEQPVDKICNIPKCESLIELNLRNRNLILKCPKCHSPSESMSGSKYCCARNLCGHVFCEKCFGPYLINHVCSLLKLDEDDLPKIIIGSKKSKKNLRRL